MWDYLNSSEFKCNETDNARVSIKIKEEKNVLS